MTDVDVTAGTRLYDFIADRLDERMRDRYPGGNDHQAMYEYRDAHQQVQALHQSFVDAAHSGRADDAKGYLEQLAEPAAQWIDHPHHPSAGH
ncbi:hypothetical protein ACH4PU_31095 [Streptomyces sp. NPDC021100]|uniref:hypothetical protein n=1 Tax=Streptomyces sp. NPDC021100 TaxID=3365114 RepID=UPI0037B1D1EF